MNPTVSRTYEFCAAHRLTTDSKCQNVHGHNYRVEVTLAAIGDTLVNGMVLDVFTLDHFIAPIIAQLDHSDLNALPLSTPSGLALVAQPTMEHIAIYLWDRLQPLENSRMALRCTLRVYEEAGTWCEMTRNGP